MIFTLFKNGNGQIVKPIFQLVACVALSLSLSFVHHVGTRELFPPLFVFLV